MLTGEVPFINEKFFAERVGPEQLDALLAHGWRHFGTHFFRYSYGFYDLDIRRVLPLRVRLANFSLSRSQRRTLRKNHDVEAIVRPIAITTETEELFEKHKTRFKTGVPESVYDFLSPASGQEPCEAREVAVYHGRRLVAVSYIDIGVSSTSGIYAMFDPADSARRLGIFTMLKEIELSINEKREFYYQGYSYEGSSFYDYKKQFGATEWFDWQGNWLPLESEL